MFVWERALRFRSMKNQKEVERRVKILRFWKEHGEKAAMDAFSVSRRTLYRWSASLRHAKGRVNALDPKSTAPNKRRERRPALTLTDRIIKLRTEHYRLGKKKLAVILLTEGFAVSESYCGRVLSDLKRRGLLPSGKKLSYYAKTGRFREQNTRHRNKIRRKQKSGVEVDTIVRFIDGTKRYILTAIDVQKKFAFAVAYATHSSASASDFLRKLKEVLPYPLTEVQTDNGSEFAMLFDDVCEKLGITHYHTYARCPKMNCHVERFNRTVWEGFIAWNRALLRDDISAFNDKLITWLLWYNTERPHESLGMVSPLRYIVSTLSAKECQMWWTRTDS